MIGDGCSSISNCTASNECHEFPFADDQDSGDVITKDDNNGLTSSLSASSMLLLDMSGLEVASSGAGILHMQNVDYADATGSTDTGGGGGGDDMCWDAPTQSASTTQDVVPPPSPSLIIPHRGSLRRFLNPSAFASMQNANPNQSTHSQPPTSVWPIYIINVATEDYQQQNQHYEVIFERQQYEFCTRLFAVLDTESESFVGPECIREFVSLHCPVVRRRDYAIFALRSGEEDEHERNRGSPTFDEIWDRTIHSDPQLAARTDGSSEAKYRIGIEGWMIFCRILALAHHQETQRRFASRHLQQMMRHKHGGEASPSKPNEVVVVVENPPPGPPALISICGLVEIEKERIRSNFDECIHGWPFCPLPLPELDLDHCLGNDQKLMQRKSRGRVSIEKFSSATDGDFILRLHKNGSTIVVRRSYSDFQWLNEVLKLHKRPGQGHLCGRILPPLPLEQGGFLHQHSSTPSGAIQPKDISERAIGVAKSGMMIISSITKSVFSGFVLSSTPSSSPQPALSRNTVRQVGNISPPSDTLADAAQRIQRYINYLLENDAFSTSFPLNAILKASQSGLESAKQILRDHTKRMKRQKTESAASISGGQPHSAVSIFSALIHKTSTSILRIQGDDDTRWLRAAAQVAMSLQFHGILETTGHESASAKIQHASLPKFGHLRAESWDDEEHLEKKHMCGNLQSSDFNSPRNETNFEVGVINVESELVDDEQDFGGYDLLPSPGPSVQHRVLNAGVSNDHVSGKSSSTTFVYDATSEQSKGNRDKKEAVVGSVKVESDIDKLRDIILSTKHTLGKLHQSSASIQSAQAAKNAIQLYILRDVDSWADHGSEVITQRALVTGVAALEACNREAEGINKSTTDDLLWQSLLSASAVGAVSEVRDAVRASRTASRAKSAAYVAAEKSKKAYEACDRALPMEKVRHAQLDASTAQSHAIHATVVEYEANVAMKSSAVSFAHDVKSWNKHRKNELLRTCIKVAKSQRDACRKAADAWENIRDGLVDFSACTVAIAEANTKPNLMDVSKVRSMPMKQEDVSELEVQTYEPNLMNVSQAQSLPLKKQNLPEFEVQKNESHAEEVNHNYSDHDDAEQSPSLQKVDSEQQTHSESFTYAYEEGLSYFNTLKERHHPDIEDEVYCLTPPQFSHLNEDYFSFHQDILVGSNSDTDETEAEDEQNHTSSTHGAFDSQHGSKDAMSTSMQSMIDDLLAWGGGDDDIGENEEIPYETNDDVDCSSGNEQIDTMLM